MKKVIHIYTKKTSLTSQLIEDNEALFQYRILDEGFSFTELELQAMREVDGITSINGSHIETKFGACNLSQISTGLKTILNIIYILQNNLRCSVSLNETGPKALQFIFKNIDTSKIQLYLTHDETGNLDRYIFNLNNGEKVYEDTKKMFLEEEC